MSRRIQQLYCGSSGPWKWIFLISFILYFFFLIHSSWNLLPAVTKNIPAAVPSESSELASSFFTLTPRGFRTCYLYSNESRLSIGYIFLEESFSFLNQTSIQKIKSNLIYSLRRSGANPFIRILKSTSLMTKQEKLTTLLRYIESHQKILPRILLISNSLTVLMLSSPKSLEDSFVSFHKRLILSKDNPYGLAIGYKKDILKFFFPIVRERRFGFFQNVNHDQLKKTTELHYLKKHTDDEIFIDENSLLLATKSSDSSRSTGVHILQFIDPISSVTGFSTLYNLCFQSSMALRSDEAPHQHHHHSYDHFLNFRSQYRVVMSLTTLPHRLPHLTPVLRSLLDQHIKPDLVYLNIPSNYRRFQKANDSSPLHIPNDIMQLAINDVLRIQRTPVDYGPATKLIPTLQVEKDPKTIIITVDDDMIYKPTQVQILLKAYFQYPFASYGHAGQLIDLDQQSRPQSGIRSQSSRRRIAVRTAWQWKDSHYAVDILEAFRCALYRRDYFPDLSELISIPDSCIFTDDIWISAYLSRRGIPRIKLAQGWGDVAEFSPNDNITPLRDQNLNGTKRNDICAEKLLQDFVPGWITSHEMEENGNLIEDCLYQYRPL